MAFPSSPTALASASLSNPTGYDVFLNFYGKDTRYTFTSHLYAALDHHGINTYMDDPVYAVHDHHGIKTYRDNPDEKRREDKIPDALRQVIRNARTCIVVLSQNYASSSHCLDELVEILNCHQTIGQLVPVFYNVDPLVVQHQTGTFNEALQNHEACTALDKLAKWRLALTNVGKLSAYKVFKNMCEFDVINQVVEKVLLEIQPMTLHVAKYPVGLDSRVQEITKLMSRDTESVMRIGIHGMGGVGKTTLAKAVYNHNYRHFQGSCFLENVGEVSGTKRGLVRLQQQLINDVLKFKNIIIDNVDHGIELIRARICSMKVLIVIDDLENPTPLDFLEGPFALGSRILITTRNEDLLDLIEVQAKYKAHELGDGESRQLFTKLAFGDDKISNTFIELSEQIIQRAGGLPLALEDFASRLLNQSEKRWRQFIKRLKRVPIDNIEKELVTSFDVLNLVDPMLQNIFLDIACFFIGWKKEEAVKILETCYMFVNIYIDILMKRCLLTINNRDELGMHDMLRDMGKKIVCNNSPNEPGKHSRLWVSQDICNVLKKGKGTNMIEGIIPHNLDYQDELEGVSFTTATFTKMSKLRFLYLENLNLNGSFENTFENLTWFCWKRCPLESLPSDFYLENLVSLSLPHSKMKTMWELNKVLKFPAKLKTLTMSYSLDLTTTPDFTELPCLETLNLEHCESLEEVHVSIGLLARLVSLNLSGCVKLRRLPNSICNLKALKSLNIGGCSSLEELPLELGNIESLIELNAWGLTISKLPDSVARFSKFVELNLSDNEYTETPSSSASDSTPIHWDVFLSFHFEDTRFSSFLCSALDRQGVGTFMDDTQLRNREVISDSLMLQAVRKSKAYIVVLSENYASSGWCLDELVEIFNCHNMMQRAIIPVFYNIDPLFVQHQTGSIEEAFKKHESLLVGEMEKVNKWRLTLKEVAGLSGYHVSRNRSEADIINKIVDEILLKINPKALDVAKYPVGLDSSVKAITALLNSATEGVIRIGIYGVGGAGKTTLAKALYNQFLGNYKGSCFLANVREVSRKTKGLVTLQQQLIDDVLKCKKKVKVFNVEEGTKFIKERVCSAKVLVLIDDIDDLKQYESLVGPFASGSIVIITTRDRKILDKIEVEPRYRCKVKELNDSQSFRLLNAHAFGNSNPSSTSMVLSKEILGLAGGLPLALEVFGSYLSTQSGVGWKAGIEKLQRNPSFTIQQKLMICFDALQPDDSILKDIFLDIACFFIGRKREYVVNIMETYYSHVDRSIDILKKRCLLTISNKDELQMHDLLRDIGRETVRNHYANKPGKPSRLWVSKDICDILKKPKGSEAIEGIVFSQDANEGVSISTEAFKTMSRLRFMYLEKVNLTGNFKQKFEDLRWLCWDCCPLKCFPSEFSPQKLVILELPHSKMRTMWALNMVPQVFEKLKTLSMKYSLDLTTTPDFTKLPCLETLDFEHCESLEEVQTSIGSLVRLIFLNFGGCMNLKDLPDSICNLRALKSLNISGCRSLKKLPTEMGNIESLTELNARGITVSKLPDSIGRLSKLVKLNLILNKNLEALPSTICSLRALKFLDISYCTNLEALPPGIVYLSNLEYLNLSDCHHLLSIIELPPTLKVLRVFGCTSMKRLPNLSNLKRLETLDLTYCLGLEEILGLEELISLRELHLRGCNSSLLAYTLTKHLFQIYSGFGQQINIYAPSAEFPDWIRQSPYWNSQSPELAPNVSSKFLGMIFCFKHLGEFYRIDYSVKTMRNGFIWSDSLHAADKYESLLVIVPRSIFSVTDGDNRIESTTDDELCLGIHLLYRTDQYTMIDEYCTTVDIENERSYLHPSKRLKSDNNKLRRSERSHKPNPRYLD